MSRPLLVGVPRFPRILGILLFLAGLGTSYGQELAAAKGSINGTATDQTQAVVLGAKATLTNAAGEKYETQVDEKGQYSFTGLKPGLYTLTVTAPNFAATIFDHINLAAGLELTLDAPLAPLSEKTEVNVESGGVGTVDTESASVSGTITQKEVVSLGLNGRNFTQLIALAPGVSNQTGQDEAKVGVVGSVKYSVNGGRVEYNTFEVDGSDVLNTGLNGAASTLMVYPSLDAIQEVKVLTSNYGAQYGRTASGTVQVTTKSGTSQWHGNLYDFVRNEAFNSRNFFDIVYTRTPAPGQTVGPTIGNKAPLYRRQDFGGTIGGPSPFLDVFNTIKTRPSSSFPRNSAWRKRRRIQPGCARAERARTILTPQGVQRNLQTNPNTGAAYQDFDFSDVCPLTRQRFLRAQYPDCPSVSPGGTAGTFVPLPHLQGVRELRSAWTRTRWRSCNANLIPLPNAPFGCNFSITNFNSASPDPNDPNRCYDAAVSPSTYWREELFRIDHTLTDKLKVSFRYIHDSWDTTVLNPQWSYLSIDSPGSGNVSHHPEPFLWAGHQPGGAPNAHDIADSAERSGSELCEFDNYADRPKRAGRRAVPAQSSAGSAARDRSLGSGAVQSGPQR